MAEDEDGTSNKKSSQNSIIEGRTEENEHSVKKPDLGIEEAKYNSHNEDDKTSTESKASSSGGAIRKEENPFSFRHFLKRDLSLPGNSSYESKGARPKVYANTVQHSPTKLDIHKETKDKHRNGTLPSENNSSSSSVEIPFSVMDNSDSKHNFYSSSDDIPPYHRLNLASEPLGMPSLPDFVQDHILVEQAYLNSNGPLAVDLDNLPDFTFNTNYNSHSSSNVGRRVNNSYSGNRSYDYSNMGEASTSNNSERNVPLDLPEDIMGASGSMPLDLPPHINLDLTESINTDRRNNSPHSTFPLDLPPNAGSDSMRLPDFLPVHPGRTSPEPEHHDEPLQQVVLELERTRSELFSERSRRTRAEAELSAARASLLLGQRAGDGQNHRRAGDATTHQDSQFRDPETNNLVASLREQIRQLKEELSRRESEVSSLRRVQTAVARDLTRATNVADTSLRDLLAGLEQLKSLSSRLEPP